MSSHATTTSPSALAAHTETAGIAHRGISTHTAAILPPGGSTSSAHDDNNDIHRQNRRDSGSTAERILDITMMRRVWLLRNHPYVQSCTNNILKDMFNGDGIVFLRANERVEMTDALQAYMRRHMEPFSRDVFLSKHAFGVVPITFEVVADGDGLGPARLVPFVPAFGTYIITTRSVRGRQYFHFYWNQIDLLLLDAAIDNNAPCYVSVPPIGERDESVIVAHGFGYDPDLSGRLMSNFSSILHQLSALNTLSRCAVTAERISCKPPLVSQYNPALEIAAEKNHQQGYYVGDTSTDEARQEVAFSRDARELDAWKRTMRTMNETSGVSAADFGVSSFGADTHERYASSGAPERPAHIMLSSTRQLVSPQMPSVRSDLVQLGEQAMEVVCSVLSMPHCAMASRSGVRAGVESVDDQMTRTVVKEAEELGHIMTMVYDHMFGEADVYAELRALVEVKRRRISLEDAERRRMPNINSMLSGATLPPSFVPARSLVTEDDLYEIEARTRRRLAFDLPPATTQDNMHLMYARGLIDWRTYNESVLRMNNMSRSLAAHTRDPWSAEDRKSMAIATKSNSTTTSGETKKKSSGAKK